MRLVSFFVSTLSLVFLPLNSLSAAPKSLSLACQAMQQQAQWAAKNAQASVDRYNAALFIDAVRSRCSENAQLPLPKTPPSSEQKLGGLTRPTDVPAGMPGVARLETRTVQCPTGSGGFAGRVSDAASGVGLASGLVGVYNASGLLQKFAFTDPAGNYEVTGLPPGSYFAATATTSFDEYLAEAHADLPCPSGFAQTNMGLGSCTPSNSTSITVAAGATVPNINFALSNNTGFIGRVTDASNGNALASGLVGIYNAAGLLQKFVDTDINGNYRATGLLPGNYFAVTANTSFTDYLAEANSDLPCPSGFAATSLGLGSCSPANITPIVVPAGTIVANINFALSANNGMSGKVTDSASANGLAQGLLGVFNAAGLLQKFVFTDASGNYRATGLLPGNYFVVTSPTSFEEYLPEAHADVPCPSGFAQTSFGLGSCSPSNATAIAVPAGPLVANINLALSKNTGFIGRVTDANTGAGLAFGLVGIYNVGGLLQKYATTDANGDYRATGLLPGSYFAATATTSFVEYLAEANFDQPCPSGFAQSNIGLGSCTPSSATPIVVTANMIVPNINFVLGRNNGLNGRVTDAATGVGLPFGLVGIYNASGLLQKFVATDVNGDYRATGLLPGNHFAATATTSFEDYLAEAHQNVACPSGFAQSSFGLGSCTPSNATPIAVNATQVTPGIDFGLCRLAFGSRIFSNGFEN